MAIAQSAPTTPSETPLSFNISIALALVLPILVGLFARSWLFLVLAFFKLILLVFPMIVVGRILWDWAQNDTSFGRAVLKYLRPVPPYMIYGSDLKKKGVPIATIILIALNTLIFILLPEKWYGALVFFPTGDPGQLHILASVITCAFLHANFEHLFFNMIFLWIFGSVLELRIGIKRYLGFYFAAIIGSTILVYLLLIIQAASLGSSDVINEYHSLGASGAIAGLMGLFVVRCFFARIKFSVPIFILPLPFPGSGLFSLPMRIPAPVLVGLYFALDMSGSVDQFFLEDDNVDYWAHVGGYLTCILLGMALGIRSEAQEDAFKEKTVRLAHEDIGKAEAETRYEKILESDPENLEALNFIFKRQYQRGAEEAGATFAQLLSTTATKDFQAVISLCREHLPRYLPNVPSDLLAKIGFSFYRNGDLIRARYCLERAADVEGPWQPKAMIILAQIFAAIDNMNLARKIFENVVTRFPGTMFEDEAKRMLAEI